MTHLIDPIGAINAGALTPYNFRLLGLSEGEWMLLLVMKQIAEGGVGGGGSSSGGGGAAMVISAPLSGLSDMRGTAGSICWDTDDQTLYQKVSIAPHTWAIVQTANQV